MPKFKPRRALRHGKRPRHQGTRERRWLLRVLVQRTGGKCEYCSRQVSLKDEAASDYATVDHVVARANGGRDSPENLRLACRRCNLEKGSGIAVDGAYAAAFLRELKLIIETRHWAQDLSA